jgi:isopentenyl-diphosphate delta-isomerase
MASPDPSVVLVDAADRPLGLMARSLAHAGHGHRHRAFTVLVFDRGGRLALARRSSTKALWPGAFDGTVASHPRPAEPIAKAARRRLREELGLDAEPRSLGRFDYQIQDGPRGAEAELCYALLAEPPAGAELRPAADEIDRLIWRTPADLLADPRAWPEHCPWLWPALELLSQDPGPLGLALRPERPRLARASAQAFVSGRLSWPPTA